jgi:hypothetical protein
LNSFSIKNVIYKKEKYMKTKVVLIGMLASLVVGSAVAQENDDMYFTAKDRAKLNASRSQATILADSKKSKSRMEEVLEEETNPTDSYSARNVNPEFTSRSNSEVARYDNEDYFVSNFRTQNQYNSWNRGFNSWYNNPWYSSAYNSSNIYGWNSPYYGSYYDSWGNPWNNPYYRSGWSSSFSYYWGNSYNYGWNNPGYGWNNAYGWNCPFNGYNNYGGFYGPSYAYNPYRSGWYGYPTTVVVVGSSDSRANAVYGKRASRGTTLVSNGSNGSRSRQAYTSNRTPDSGGRVTTKQDEYYKPARRTYSSPNTSNQSTYSQDSRNTTQNNRSSSWSNDNNRSSNSSYTPSRSSTNSTGGTTRSSSSSSSGSNGRTRGRD